MYPVLLNCFHLCFHYKKLGSENFTDVGDHGPPEKASKQIKYTNIVTAASPSRFSGQTFQCNTGMIDVCMVDHDSFNILYI